MKAVLPKQRNLKPLITPPIPFEKPEPRQLKKDEHITMKLRTVGNDPTSATREISVPHFKKGTPEELLIFLQTPEDKIVSGQNLDAPAKKCATMKTTLKGDALSCWNNESKNFAETEENFVILKKLLTKHVFPRRALRLQKRYMRRHMRKPADVSMRDYGTRCIELNNYLELFPDGRFDDEGVPTGFSPRQKPGVDELADIVEFGTPSSWQKKMAPHGFCTVHANS